MSAGWASWGGSVAKDGAGDRAARQRTAHETRSRRETADAFMAHQTFRGRFLPRERRTGRGWSGVRLCGEVRAEGAARARGLLRRLADRGLAVPDGWRLLNAPALDQVRDHVPIPVASRLRVRLLRGRQHGIPLQPVMRRKLRPERR